MKIFHWTRSNSESAAARVQIWLKKLFTDGDCVAAELHSLIGRREKEIVIISVRLKFKLSPFLWGHDRCALFSRWLFTFNELAGWQALNFHKVDSSHFFFSYSALISVHFTNNVSPWTWVSLPNSSRCERVATHWTSRYSLMHFFPPRKRDFKCARSRLFAFVKSLILISQIG